MADNVRTPELEVVTQVLAALEPLEADARERVIRTVSTFFGISPSRGGLGSTVPDRQPSSITPGGFSEDRSLSPKEFILQKQPKTDVERVAALAYYLTHYRDTPFFKTLDISKLNTEAAQMKFANAANAVDNATKQGYLVPGTRGNKQLSATGELFVNALPERDAARQIMSNARPRRRAKKSGSNDGNADRDDHDE